MDKEVIKLSEDFKKKIKTPKGISRQIIDSLMKLEQEQMRNFVQILVKEETNMQAKKLLADMLEKEMTWRYDKRLIVATILCIFDSVNPIS